MPCPYKIYNERRILKLNNNIKLTIINKKDNLILTMDKNKPTYVVSIINGSIEFEGELSNYNK